MATAAEIQKHVEVQSKALPPATLENLQQMRREQCSGGSDFRLSSFQLFLRRILSPDSPVRNMLLVHGTGSGKTCSAIQVAEEYILRPEFQDKKVMVVSSATVQDNFRTQLFDVQRVKQDPSGLLKSPQCTGRRYLEMLERAQSENMRWENPENRERLGKIVQRMIDEFYDFTGYIEFSNMIERQSLALSANDFAGWIRKTFNGKLLIIDEAHNLREGNSDEGFKLVSAALQKVVKIAEGMTLVLLTATPMYDSFGEIMFLLNLFLWNDKRQTADSKVLITNIFNPNGTFVSPEAEARFRGYCHDYVSFIRGENPFTFPFRLPPPKDMIAPLDRKVAFKGKTKKITEPRKYLPLAVSYVRSPQKERVASVSGKNVQEDMIPTIVVSPDGRAITKCFDKSTDMTKAQYRYAAGVESFLSPSNIANHAAKFATILKCIQESKGIVFVYSNYVRGGALQFAMALEEHGYEPAVGIKLLENLSGEFAGAAVGRYAFLTSDMTDRQLQTLIRRLRNPSNALGQDIRVVIASPLVSEGIDLKNIRQIHILDPWYNMSRMEQIIGRGLRNCSHAGLPFSEQNCTVYLHITRYEDSATETYDEYVYRVFVESKAKSIAVVKRVLEESAVDCMTQLTTNQLPDDWRALVIPQTRAQKGEAVEMKLSEMSAPSFTDSAAALVCWAGAAPGADDTYVRPLSSYLDIRDEIFDTLLKLFETKPIWSRDDLLETLHYAPDVVAYILDNAIRSHLKLKDASGRIGVLENREGLYAFSPNEISDGTMLERSVPTRAYASNRKTVGVEEPAPAAPAAPAAPEPPPPAPAPAPPLVAPLPKFKFPFDASRFSEAVRKSFIVDQVMTIDERQTLILSGAVPEFEQKVEGTEYVVLGEGKVFDADKNPIELVGGDLDTYKTWVSKKMDQLLVEIAEHNKILCTVEWDTKKKGVLKIASFSAEGGEVKRTETSKTIIPKACSFYKTDQLRAFMHVFTEDIPEDDVSNKEHQCIFLSLLCRTPSAQTVWVPPEVWSVISENKSNALEFRKRIKEKQIAQKK